MAGAKEQYKINAEIEELIRKKLDVVGSANLDKKYFSSDQLRLLRQYSGAGGLASQGAVGKGLLNEFYTPDWLCAKMWELARYHGYDDKGTILEPSCATGNLIANAKNYKLVTAFETNPISFAIAKILYPEITIYNQYFETAFLQSPRYTTPVKDTTWLSGYPFSLVIGNPPYGIFKNQYSGYFNKKLYPQIENFFIYKGVELLKKDGLLVFIQSSNFLSNGDKYNGIKEALDGKVELIDAYRLPSVFAFSEVPTDIMILKKL